MDTCHQCGAALTSGAMACAYCGAPSALQRHMAYQQHQVELHYQVARQQEAQASIRRTATHSVIWSALGMFCCLIPVFGVVGMVMALRARKLAKKYGLVIPAMATLGLVMGAFSLIASVAAYTLIIVLEMRRAERIDALEHAVKQGVQAQQLAPTTACDLAELRLLKDGIAGKSGGTLEDFECTGKLVVTGDSAMLDDYSFRTDSSSRHRVKVCYRRGARWTTSGFRVKASCSGADDSAQLFPEEDSRSAPPEPSAATSAP